MSDGLDIPAFLDRKRNGLRHTLQRINPSYTLERIAEKPNGDSGLGSVARRLGYPEAPEDAQARADMLANAYTAKDYERDKAKAEYFERKRAEKEAEREMKAAIIKAKEQEQCASSSSNASTAARPSDAAPGRRSSRKPRAATGASRARTTTGRGASSAKRSKRTKQKRKVSPKRHSKRAKMGV